MAEEHPRGKCKCILCGGSTLDDMVVCFQCFFKYDNKTYNRKDLEKKRKKPQRQPQDAWPPVANQPASPSQARVLNQASDEFYDLVEEPEQAPPSLETEHSLPRALPTLTNRFGGRKRNKGLFSSFSWLLDSARS